MEQGTHRIRIKNRHPSSSATGGFLYEIEPVEYMGDWELEENTVLEVVEPDQCKSERKESS